MSKEKIVIDIIASTKTNHKVSGENALILGGKAAGICYLQGDKDIFNEEKEKTLKRVKLTLGNGHHSVYEHTSITLHIKNLPKILSIILVSEKQHCASIKSGRYTIMDRVSEKEKELYYKWLEKFEKRIGEVYPKIPDRLRSKLSMENARYIISVFMLTKGIFTFNIRQLNYLIHWFKQYVEENGEKDNYFTKTVCDYMQQFIDATSVYYIEDMVSGKNRSLSLFKKDYINYDEYFGDTYSVNYKCSYVELEQILRHRTINYTVLDDISKEPKEFFIPPIFDKGSDLEKEWLKDLDSIKHLYPNASLFTINERSIVENFIMKCYERMCGAAQLETMLQTKDTLKKYIANTDGKLKKELEKYLKSSCLYPDKECKMPCVWGSKWGINRRI
jgi:thymidylate synthase ThyX